ncbi:MAG: hypoxanthine phosphoribosyltransferase [Elusimicrobia bacterium RBG_16_66_12]|nr:MAG: hypoxanthine phosphoribosyltransferase [Elusimicrobia bacterium RBG_16_66_12]
MPPPHAVGKRPTDAPSHPDILKILLDEQALRSRTRELGAQISRDYAGRRLLVVGVLKGSLIFMADLLRAIGAEVDVHVDFVAVASYAGTASTGTIRVLLDLRENPEGRDVLVVEDIVDTGLTLTSLTETLRARRPRSLEVCTLLDKPDCRKIPFQPKYVGFKIPNEFVVGFGLDFDERYRQLPYVGVLRAS